MSLSKEQIDQVKTFINRRGFSTIEVEMEILDHVACIIETELEKNPALDVDKAIQTIHRSFGVMGFSVFEDNLVAGFGKKLGRMFRKELWLHWSTKKVWKVLLTIFLLFSLLTFWKNTLNPHLFKVAAFCTLALLGMLPAFYHQRIFKKWGKKSLILGRLLWPFVFGSFSIAYVINLLPVQLIESERTLFNLIILCISALAATSLWSAYSFTRKVYAWTQERWLKYTCQEPE